MKKKRNVLRTAVSALAISSLCVSLQGVADHPFQIGDGNGKVVQAAEVELYTATIDGMTWVYEKGKSMDANFQSIDAVKNIRPENKETLPSQVEIPKEIDGMPVLSVAEHAFSNTGIQKVVLPDSVTTINTSAFANCEGLTDIVLPKEVTNVYKHAFENCKAIREVCVRNVYDYAFSGCTNLEKVSFTLSSYSTEATIKSHAFENCTSLNELAFAENTTKINVGSYGFAGCSALKKWSVPRAMLDISYFGFSDCTNLADFDFARNTYAQYGAFQNCTALTELVFKGPATLGLGTFDQCSNLKTVTFEDNAYQSYSAKSQSVFSNCTSLNQVAFNGKESDIEISEEKIGAQKVNVTRSNEPMKREVPQKKEMAAGTDVLSHRVIFDGNGGLIDNLINKKEQLYEGKAEVTTFPSVVKEGYQLDGWYNKAEGGEKVTTVTCGGIQEVQTVYAHWEPVTVNAGALRKVSKKTRTSCLVSIVKQDGVSGYEVIYAKKKNFSGAKKKSSKTNSVTLSSLSKGKVYYVKVRAYKLDSAGKKVYGKYSSTKQVKL